MQKQTDRFGNTLITFQEKPSIEFVKVEIENTTTPIMFINIPDDIAQELNLEYYFTFNNMKYYLKRNCSTCPKLFNGAIFSASAVIIVKYLNRIYAIFGKDKTKPFATLIGGTADSCDFKNNKINYFNTVKREIDEETNGIIKIDSHELKPFSTIYFTSTLFGKTDIPDTSKIFGFIFDHPFEKLFNQKNKVGNNFKLNIENSETEYLIAVEIDVLGYFEPIQDFEKSMETITKMKGNLPISKMALFLTRVFLDSKKHYSCNDSDFLKKMGFPPIIKSIEF